jgi:hypothetical protein
MQKFFSIIPLLLALFCAPVFGDHDVQRVEVVAKRLCDGQSLGRSRGSGPILLGGRNGSIAGPRGGIVGSTAMQADPPAVDNSNKEDCGKSTANPVVIATGEKYKEEMDFLARGEYGLSLQRTYRSKQAAGKMFGPHWLSNLDVPRLQINSAGCTPTTSGQCIPRSVTVTDANGTKYLYGNVGGINSLVANPGGDTSLIAATDKKSSTGKRANLHRNALEANLEPTRPSSRTAARTTSPTCSRHQTRRPRAN